MKQPRRTSGVKLIELLVVIAIIVLLANLFFVIIAEVRRRAYEPPCMANLRQVWIAFHNYREDYSGTYPRHSWDMKPYFESAEILKCPRDVYGGINLGATSYWGSPVSYFYLVANENFRRILKEKDANHGMMYCLLHGQSRISQEALRNNFPQYLTSGTVLRLRIDGSIQRAYVPSLCYRVPGQGGITKVRHDWHLLTDVRPCPPEICFGLKDEWQVPCPFSF